MVTVKETAKGRLLEHDGIRFWIQKRWQKANGTLTPAGKKAMAIEADFMRRHAGFDASKIFPVMQETDKAVLLECELAVYRESEPRKMRFWVPRSMLADYRFIRRKLHELETSIPFVSSATVVMPGGKP